ncbi:MAG: alpha-2-macroglobulin family protein [Gemmataceae bacterium]
MNKKIISLAGAGLLLIFGLLTLPDFMKGDARGADESTEKFRKLFNQGNFKEAFEGFKKLALAPKADARQAGNNMNMAIQSLRNLGRNNEVDDFRDSVISIHEGDWRFLQMAADSFLESEHFGFLIAGKFERGYHRGGGRQVSSYSRDRARVMQLLYKALEQVRKDKDLKAASLFYLDFADIILRGSSGHESWRLQVLTDFSTLPEYDDSPYWHPYHGVTPAPVDETGKPVFYKVPESFEKAANDGERWRSLLQEAAIADPSRKNISKMRLAQFLYQQFGVHTLAGYFPGFMEDTNKETGTYDLANLKDEETIARIASGIKRLTLPDEFNYLKIWHEVALDGKTIENENAADMIAIEYENRRQYPKAAEAWKKAIAKFGGKGNYNRSYKLEQIVGNWGRFEPAHAQVSETKADIQFRFRNARTISLEAIEINVPRLLADVRKYLKDNPGRLEYEKININDIGQRILNKNQEIYLGKKVANWEQKLEPRPAHNDARVGIDLPKLPAGAYFLVAKLEGGNTSRIVVWLNDLAIVKKSIDGKGYYFVCDSVTGLPEESAKLDFFGWRQEQIKPNQNNFKVVTREFSKQADKDGQVFVDGNDAPNSMQWLVQASGREKRQAYLGFSGLWYANYQDNYFQQIKAFAITDRPVYRPGQKVEFKLWAAEARYDLEGPARFAGQNLKVVINNPKGEKVFEKTMTADAFGGVTGSFDISKDATLGSYYLHTANPGNNAHGGIQFRVEEYKKPEFEVKVEAPTTPVMLGEKIPVTVVAKYYFGAPVSKGKAKIKVTRQSKSTDWHPLGVWDWFYGRGYWWFSPDYSFYDGWEKWGCGRPHPFWYPRVQGPGEIVLEQESPIGPDGTVKLEIDTALAKQFHGNQDHEFSISAEVVDESRRTINGSGKVIVARKPFRVFAWLNRGHFQTGDTIEAFFQSQTPDGKPVPGAGDAVIYKISYDKAGKPIEQPVDKAMLRADEQGKASYKFKPLAAGQYRVSLTLADEKGHKEEGGYLFNVYGKDFDGKSLKFNDLELIMDKKEFAPGDRAKLLINANQNNATVLLFTKPVNGLSKAPKVIRMDGKNSLEEIIITQGDMPNTFVEVLTVSNGKVHTEMKELVVPPEKRILNVTVVPDKAEYKPGEKGKIKVKVTDLDGRPVAGSIVLTAYDRSVEYISGGSNVPDIKEYFWKWRRHHHPSQESTLAKSSYNLLKPNEVGMGDLGVFGNQGVDEFNQMQMQGRSGQNRLRFAKSEAAGFGGGGGGAPMALAANMAMDGVSERRSTADRKSIESDKADGGPGAVDAPPGPDMVQPTIRKNFADTALWVASIEAGPDGTATADITMPENLTGWKMRAWSISSGTRVGEGETIVTTRKDLLVRLQSPRFFTQNDEVILSANIHNYLKDAKTVEVSLELDGNVLKAQSPTTIKVPISPNGEKRVDWKVKVVNEGKAIVRVKGITDVESDAMEMSFPAYVHGMARTESFSGAIRPNQESAKLTFNVPEQRRENDSRLEIRYSPTLAGALVDALPYLAEYPYGCTEQTLNRFVPTVITMDLLRKLEVDLAAVREKRTNLNAQEIGDPMARAKGWKRFQRNPVFDPEEVKTMTREGIKALQNMQLSDGGWGWFSGYGEYSQPHTTAIVVHGLQIARGLKVELPANMLERGITWLKNHQDKQVELIKRAPAKTQPYKNHADDLDALVYMVLLDADVANPEMNEFLYRDRTHVSAYAKAVFGIALFKQKQQEKLDMILRNLEQFLVQDDENQTAYLKLPPENHWWNWYGSDTEANAWYLKLLSKTNPKGEVPAKLAKYILNNRKHATYWNSTRDTAFCIEALAEFFTASGEDKPDMTVEVLLDGKMIKEVKIGPKDLFTFENTALVLGDGVLTGNHTVELRKKGTGPLYFNAYLTVFTLETPIKKAGLEVKINRKYYLLKKSATEVKVPGARGEAVNQRGEKYERIEIQDLSSVKSGDLVEIEMEILSKNDYEYILIEDMKAAGFEPLELRSGYGSNDMRAYMELRDERVCFFVRQLARGNHSLRYRMRAEIPGLFHALPAKINGMYAPELVGNSDEIRVNIEDAPLQQAP